MKKLYAIFLFMFVSFSVLATDEVKLIALYPVPLKDNTLHVKVNYSGSGIAKVELRSLIGKKIQEKDFPANNEEILFNDVDVNPNGVYLVVAKNANGKVLEISKFILNK